MQPDEPPGSLPLQGAPAEVQGLGGGLVRDGRRSLSAWGARVVGDVGLSIAFGGRHEMRGHLCPVVAYDDGVEDIPPFPRDPFGFSAGKETNMSSSHLALTHPVAPPQLLRLPSHLFPRRTFPHPNTSSSQVMLLGRTGKGCTPVTSPGLISTFCTVVETHGVGLCAESGGKLEALIPSQS